MTYDYGKLNFIDCVKITARGWLKQQLLCLSEGMGGHLDELVPYGCTNLRITCFPKAQIPPIKHRF